jgi:hypothetical protein
LTPVHPANAMDRAESNALLVQSIQGLSTMEQIPAIKKFVQQLAKVGLICKQDHLLARSVGEKLAQLALRLNHDFRLLSPSLLGGDFLKKRSSLMDGWALQLEQLQTHFAKQANDVSLKENKLAQAMCQEFMKYIFS